MPDNVHHTAEIVAHERTSERMLLPFAIAMGLLAIGFIVAMIALYR